MTELDVPFFTPGPHQVLHFLVPTKKNKRSRMAEVDQTDSDSRAESSLALSCHPGNVDL